MISMLLYAERQQEVNAFCRLGRELAGTLSDEDWRFSGFSDRQKLLSFLGENPLIDLCCLEITDSGSVEAAERLRRSNKEMFIILLADAAVPPTLYIRPSVMAGSLLLRPLSSDSVRRVFSEAFGEYLKKLSSGDGDAFVIDSRDGRQLVPYGRISYFESRDKRLYVNTGDREFSFYDTLDNLEQRLPDGFARCHRSFIVNLSAVKKVMLSQGMIELNNDGIVPLSRSYKTVFKELK